MHHAALACASAPPQTPPLETSSPVAAAGTHPTPGQDHGPGRKIRSDAKLEQLGPEQQERLRFWLEEENRSYAEIADRLRAEFGVSVGKSAVALYWRRHLLPELHDEEAETAAAIAALPVADLDTATLNRARSLAWTELTSPFPQPETAARMLDLVHRADRLTLARQRMALEERRVALREAQASLGPEQAALGGRVERAEAAAAPVPGAFAGDRSRTAGARIPPDLSRNFVQSP
jgi:hypothetical protein